MYKIIHPKNYTYEHPIFKDIEVLFTQTANKKQSGLLTPSLPKIFSGVIDYFNLYGGCKFSFTYVDKQYEKLKLPDYDPKNIIVCMSGGKDSLATAFHYQKLGYNVYLYHVTGLNKTYYNEWKQAQLLAQKLGVPIYIEDVSYTGVHDWVEHPCKNMVFAAMAIQYGIRSGITTKIATGNFRSSSLQDNPFAVCAGDCNEMWSEFEKIVGRVIPRFTVYRPNRNYQTAFLLLEKHPELLEYTISCLTPNRFREHFRKRTLKNFPKIRLLPNRCGCCWKCAAEWIWFCDHGIFEYDEDYYIHCLKVLKNTLKKENGIYFSDLRTVWCYYFWYSIDKSRLFGKGGLRHAAVRNNKEDSIDTIAG